MIKSYSCSMETPNNIYLGSTVIPKVEGVCDGDRINLGITSNTHRHLALTSLYSFCNSCFELLILATELVSNTQGLLRTLLRYTIIYLCSLCHPSYPPSIWGSSASSDHFLCSRSTQFQAWVQLWVSSRERNLLAILLEVPFLSLALFLETSGHVNHQHLMLFLDFYLC